MTYYIYALLNSPRNIFYVGQTIDPMRRLAEHRSSFHRKFGNNIILKVLQEVEGKDAADTQERAWIQFYDYFYDLENRQGARTPWEKEIDMRMARYHRNHRVR